MSHSGFGGGGKLDLEGKLHVQLEEVEDPQVPKVGH